MNLPHSAQYRRRTWAVALVAVLALASGVQDCNSLGGDILKLTIELPSDSTVVHQPLPARLTLTNNGPDTKVPVEYEESDVLTFYLYSEDGKLLNTADGYTTEMRIGQQPEIIPHQSMKTANLPSNRAMQWTNDLLGYFDLDEPGRYAVEARFAFSPSGIDIRTDRLTFTVEPNRCRWLTFHVDQVAIALILYLERHEAGDDATTLVHFARPDEPTHFWKGHVVPVPADVHARLSQTDFATVESFEHDFRRWITWIEDGTVAGLRIDDNGQVIARLGGQSVKPGSMMIGNPIQHEDQGVSVLILEKRASTGQALVAYRFDAAGSAKGTRPIITYSDTPDPITLSCDWNQNLYIFSANMGRLPLEVVTDRSTGKSHRQVLLSPGDLSQEESSLLGAATVIAVRADTGIHMAKDRGLLALLVARNKEGRRFVFAHFSFAKDGTIDTKAKLVESPFPGDLFAKDEKLTAATTAQDSGNLYGTLTTSKGRVFFIEPDQPPQEVVTVPIEGIGQADLYTLLGGVYIVHPTDTHGMKHTLVKKPMALPVF